MHLISQGIKVKLMRPHHAIDSILRKALGETFI